jgi:hypothetical protein
MSQFSTNNPLNQSINQSINQNKPLGNHQLSLAAGALLHAGSHLQAHPNWLHNPKNTA